MIPPPIPLDPKQPDLAARIAEIPNISGVFLLIPDAGAPYLGSSASIGKRLARLLLHNSTSSNSLSNIRMRLCRIDYWFTGSRLGSSLLLYWLALQFFPDTYRKRLKLKDPWVLTLLPDEFPRLAVRSRLASKRIATFGPFPTRDTAERVCQGVSGLFQVRRCEETLRPSEDHPGCVYGEMNLCLRPCQLAVTPAEYAAEVARLSDFLHSNGKQAQSNLIAARDRASSEMDFEQAARLHKELEKVKAVAGLRDDLVTEVESLNGIALTRGSGEGQAALWPMLGGFWQPPLVLDFSDAGAAESPDGINRSLDHQIREQLSRHLSAPRTEGNRAEELSILSRWYYSSWRDGEWFGFRTLGDLNPRKLVREISRLLRPAVPSRTA